MEKKKELTIKKPNKDFRTENARYGRCKSTTQTKTSQMKKLFL